MEVVLEGFSAIWEQNEVKIPVKACGSSFLLFIPREPRTRFPAVKPARTVDVYPAFLSSSAPSLKATLI